MTDDEKRGFLMEAAIALQNAQSGPAAIKLMLKLQARDAIKAALLGTVAQAITEQMQNEIAPHCAPFSETQFLRMAALAGAVALGKDGLVRAYGPQILEVDLGL
ncbi:hypothetical protein C4C32_17965 [Pseudomonas corrugata]|uniref:Uncharacterized protein n=1 Tax=Pseudomonas corrugata TaxID=47879 RepID=A0A8B6UKP6_9PSED|nr:hypothetical protein [Pseudomonas corrugata]QTH12473.1 hypothetical protein C4C32_17965 [Pseudomonas corrugata]